MSPLTRVILLVATALSLTFAACDPKPERGFVPCEETPLCRPLRRDAPRSKQ